MGADSNTTFALGSMISAAGQAGSNYYAGKAKASSYNLEALGYEQDAFMDDENAVLAAYAARDAERRGSEEAKKINQATKTFAGSQRAAQGASGVVVGSGSFGEILNDTYRGGAQDAAMAKKNAAMEAWGYRQKETSYELSASGNRITAMSKRFSGANAIKAGRVNAVTSLLTGASKAAIRYSDRTTR